MLCLYQGMPSPFVKQIGDETISVRDENNE